MISLLLHELKIRWKGVLGWGIGLVLYGTMYITVYPEAGAQMTALADLSIYEVMGIHMDTFEGYIASVLLLLMWVLLGVYAIITGTKTLAGEEDSGTLELIMAKPLSRWQIVSVKALAIGIAMALIIFITALGDALVLGAIKSQFETTLKPIQLFAAVMAGWPVTMGFAMISLFLGAFLPSRKSASMVAAVILAASYFLNNLTGLVQSLDSIKPLSLFNYYDDSAAIFTEGVKASDILILLGVAAVFFVLTLLSFGRRNVTVGAWPWQRGKIK